MLALELPLIAWRIIGWLFVVGLCGAIILIARSILRKPQDKFRHIYADIPVHETPAPGTVFIRFHTYDGFLLWFTQTTHSVFAAPPDARELLHRLHRYNLTYGLFAAGVVFIPLISYFNYRAQLKSIMSQENSGDALCASTQNTGDLNQCSMEATPKPAKSIFRSAIGWIAAVLCVLFAVTTVTCIVQREYGVSVVGVICSLLFGKVARDWIPGVPT
jgi:hypothetical protein